MKKILSLILVLTSLAFAQVKKSVLIQEQKESIGAMMRDSSAYVNVKSYGAVGDGVTDNSAIIQSMIDNSTSGSTILIPAGNFYVGSGISDNLNAIHFEGVGEASVLSGSGGAIITLNNQNSSVDRLTIQANAYSGLTVGILVNNTCSAFRITNCRIKGYFANPYVGIGIKLSGAGSGGTISNNTINYLDKGIDYEYSSIAPNANLIEGNLINMNINGIYMEDNAQCNSTMIGNTIQGNEVGLYVGAGIQFNISLFGNHFENNIGSSPKDLDINAGGGSYLQSFGNFYYAFSSTAIPYGIYIGNDSEIQISSHEDIFSGIANFGSVSYSNLTIWKPVRFDFLYNAPSSPPFILHTSSTSVPAGGTWQKGSFVENSSPSVGSPMGWVCTASGSLLNNSGTGDCDGTTNTITNVTNIESFSVGEYVTLSSGFPSASEPYAILQISGTSITVNVNSNSAESSITISSIHPVFANMPDL